MKYFVVSLILIVSLSFSSIAQKFNGGILAGLSMSQVDGDTYSGYRKGGLIGGVYVNRMINDNFSWQLELKFHQKGSHHIPDSLNANATEYRLHLNYAEVPLRLNYYYKKKFILHLGLGMGYLVSFKEVRDGYRMYEDSQRYFNKYEFSYNFGLTYKLTKKIFFNISHSYSIIPIRKHATGTIYKFKLGQFNNVIAFTFYYQFNNEGK